MKQITCDTVRDLLPLYIDHVCSTDSGALVEEHLQACPACKAEYEKLSQREFLFDAKEQEVLTGLSNRWKKSRRAILWRVLAVALAVVLAGSILVYGSGEKPVPAGEIAVSSLARLENGDLVFILEAVDGVGIREIYHNELRGIIYITAVTTRISAFSASNSSESGWVFNTKDTGIKQICYVEKPGFEKTTKLTIWEEQDTVENADAQTLERLRSTEKLVDCGSDTLVEEIYQNKLQYIGSGSDDMKLLGAMRIGDVLGSYTIQLTTSSEPYGITLHFKNPVASAEREAFDAKMRAYACVILGLIDNSGWVGWTYPGYDQQGQETEVEKNFDLEAAKALAGSEIKRFDESEAALRELCEKLALY